MDAGANETYQGGVHPELLNGCQDLSDFLRYYYSALHSWPARQKYQIICEKPANKCVSNTEVEDENDA